MFRYDPFCPFAISWTGHRSAVRSKEAEQRQKQEIEDEFNQWCAVNDATPAFKNLPKEKREMTSARQTVEFTRPETMLSRVARKFQVDPKILVSRNGHGLEARNVAMWVISENCGLSLREIGEFFGGLHYSAVAQRICRTRNKYSAQAAQLLLSQMSNV